MAKLIFNPSRDSVYICFSNGKESLIYESVAEAITAIHDYYLQGKITDDEEYCLIEMLLFSENNLLDRFSVDLKSKELFNLIVRIIKDNAPMLENPKLEMCDCGEKPEHAYLTSKNGFDGFPLYSKVECFALIQNLFRDKLITESDVVVLNTLTDILPLVEDPVLN